MSVQSTSSNGPIVAYSNGTNDNKPDKPGDKPGDNTNLPAGDAAYEKYQQGTLTEEEYNALSPADQETVLAYSVMVPLLDQQDKFMKKIVDDMIEENNKRFNI